MAACLGACMAGAVGGAALSAALASPASAAPQPLAVATPSPDGAPPALPLTIGPSPRRGAGSQPATPLTVGASAYEATGRAVADAAAESQAVVADLVPHQGAASPPAGPSVSEGAAPVPAMPPVHGLWPLMSPEAQRGPGSAPGIVGTRPTKPDRVVPNPDPPYRHSVPVTSNAASSESPSPGHGSGLGEVLPADPAAALVTGDGRATAVEDQADRCFASSKLARPG